MPAHHFGLLALSLCLLAAIHMYVCNVRHQACCQECVLQHGSTLSVAVTSLCASLSERQDGMRYLGIYIYMTNMTCLTKYIYWRTSAVHDCQQGMHMCIFPELD